MEREYFVEGDTGGTRDKSKIPIPNISGMTSLMHITHGMEENLILYIILR